MASSETDCPLANIVFDLRKHNEETRKRLKSAADFVLKYAFDNPHTNPIEAMEFPDVYLGCGNDNFASFRGAKLAALNMLHLEDGIAKNYPDVDPHQMSDQDLNSILEQILKHKEQKNRDVKEPSYPKGTGISAGMLWAVMKVKPYAPKYDNSSSDLCRFCMKELKKSSICTLPYCEHELHSSCLEKMLQHYPLCPICENWALPLHVEYPNWTKDLGKVRDFLTRDSCASFLGERYITSVSVFHALMAAHLVELQLTDVLDNFQNQVYIIMCHEKQTRTDEHDMIKTELIEFLKDCRDIKYGLVERFHAFMEEMFRALRLDCVEQSKFRNRIKEEDVRRLKTWDSIRKLSTLVQAVEYVQRAD